MKKFRLLKALARGGFGTIWLAWDKENNVNVAIKMFAPVQAQNTLSPEEIQNCLHKSPSFKAWEEEIRAYSKLSQTDCRIDKHFAKFLGYGCSKLAKRESLMLFPDAESLMNNVNIYCLYMAMDLLGSSICAQGFNCARDCQSPVCTMHNKRFFLRTAHLMLEAIFPLHKAGFVHRDVKPANFCFHHEDLDFQGHLFIIDFGFLTELPGSLEEASEKSDFVGTPDYASSRALLGIRQSLYDDLQSIAFSLLEMYTGDLPWDVRNISCPAKVSHDNVGNGGVWTAETLNKLVQYRNKVLHGTPSATEEDVCPRFIRQWIRYTDSLATEGKFGKDSVLEAHGFLHHLLRNEERLLERSCLESENGPPVIGSLLVNKIVKENAAKYASNQADSQIAGSVASNERSIDAGQGTCTAQRGESFGSCCTSSQEGSCFEDPDMEASANVDDDTALSNIATRDSLSIGCLQHLQCKRESKRLNAKRQLEFLDSPVADESGIKASRDDIKRTCHSQHMPAPTAGVLLEYSE